jgi:hypothetical protein
VGKLIPGEPLIYENANGVTYARYRDPPHNQLPRWEIGRTEESIVRFEMSLWEDIMRESRKNKQLQDAIERVKIIYALSKKDQDG